MAGLNTLQIIKTIPKFDGENFVELTRSLNDMLQIAWSFLSNIIYGLQITQPILSEGREGKENTCDFDDNDSNPSDVSGQDAGNLNEELQNNDDIKALDSANEHLLSVLIVTTTSAARCVSLKFERKNGRPGDGSHT